MMNKRKIMAIVCLGVFVFVTLLLPIRDVMVTDMSHTFENPSTTYYLGTDNLGRDVYALMVSGCYRTLVVVLVATAISFLGGVLLGMLSGYYGGAIGGIIQFWADLTLTIPSFILALIFSGIFGLTPLGAGVVLGIGNMGIYIMQSTELTKSVAAQDFIEAERAMGIPGRKIVARHVLPNIFRPLKTYMSGKASAVSLQYAGLAFIGLGTDISNPDWGTMLYEYRVYMLSHPLLVVLPMIGILLIALFFQAVFDDGSDVIRRRSNSKHYESGASGEAQIACYEQSLENSIIPKSQESGDAS